MAQAKLEELDLSDNALGPVGMEGLVQFLKSPVCYSLKCLRLNNNGLGIYGGRVCNFYFISYNVLLEPVNNVYYSFRCLHKL